MKGKNQLFERQILSELADDLRNDTSDINFQIKRYDRIMSSVKVMLHSSDDHDSLNLHLRSIFGGLYVTLNSTTFETLKDKGMHSLKDHELRRSINEYYRRSRFLLDLVSWESRDFYDHIHNPTESSISTYPLLTLGKRSFFQPKAIEF